MQNKKKMTAINSLADLQTQINDFLATQLDADIQQPTLATAMKYSLMAGGKRLRPALTIGTYQALGGQLNNAVLKAACAVELLHTYSLIHDDLPAMDNDDLRRGLPTNHKKFGAGMATLAGDGLLTLAFQWLADSGLDDATVRTLVTHLSVAAGPAGMVAGQAADIEGEHQHLSLSQLQLLHSQKTGALIEYAVVAGGVLAGSTPEVNVLLDQFGQKYGLAFQIYDDLMDVLGTVEKMGKNVHKDHDEHKNTYPELLGVDATKNVLQQTLQSLHTIQQQLATTSHHSFDIYEPFLAYFKLGDN